MTVDRGRSTLSGLSVLVVEDDYYLATDMAEQIERVAGSVVGPFATSDEGVAALAATLPDCALLDINTGHGPSFELADALSARSVPFAFVTGYDAGSIPERFRGIARIEKPAQRWQIVETLNKLLL